MAEGDNLLEKPFTPASLSQAFRDALAMLEQRP
jgi:hypothetical protein